MTHNPLAFRKSQNFPKRNVTLSFTYSFSLVSLLEVKFQLNKRSFSFSYFLIRNFHKVVIFADNDLTPSKTTGLVG